MANKIEKIKPLPWRKWPEQKPEIDTLCYVVYGKAAAEFYHCRTGLQWFGKQDDDDAEPSFFDGEYMVTHWIPLPPPPDESDLLDTLPKGEE